MTNQNSKLKVAICGSMVFTDEMLETQKKLETLGNTVFVSGFAQSHLGKSMEDREKLAIKQKNENDAMREYWNLIQTVDAILVLNLDKRGVKNYIGGNAFLEMGFAYVLNKKIYVLNDLPENDIYKSEIEAMRPVVVNGDLEKII